MKHLLKFMEMILLQMYKYLMITSFFYIYIYHLDFLFSFKLLDGDHHSMDDHDSRRASSRGLIPKAKIKTVKMTFVIVFGKAMYLSLVYR